MVWCGAGEGSVEARGRVREVRLLAQLLAALGGARPQDQRHQDAVSLA